jgi:hypothetical protein
MACSCASGFAHLLVANGGVYGARRQIPDERNNPLIGSEPERPANPFTPGAEDYLTAGMASLVRQRPLGAWQVLALSAIGATLPVAILGVLAYRHVNDAVTEVKEEVRDVYYVAEEARWEARFAANDAERILPALARMESVPGTDPRAEEPLAEFMPPIVMMEIRRFGMLDRLRYAEYNNTRWLFAPYEVLGKLDEDVRGMLQVAVHAHRVMLIEE